MTAAAELAQGGPQTDLSHCPRCGYALTGLPAAHACPECGLIYDERMRYWRAERPWRRMLLLGIINGVIVAVAVVAHLYYRAYAPFSFMPRKLWFGCSAIAIGLAHFGLTLWSLACRPYVATLPQGLAWRLRGQTDHLVPWRDVRGVHIRPGGDRSFVRVQLGVRPWSLDVTSLLPDVRAADSFANCVAARLSCAHSSESTPSAFTGRTARSAS